MGYWGWRPLLSTLVICVWITGCSLTSQSALVDSPTDIPQVTLTLRVRAPRAPTASPIPPETATDSPREADGSSTYIVRPGDTLLGIALDLGRDVQALKDANPNVQPQALQVGQSLRIPPLGVGVASAATPIPTALDPPTCYDLITGSILCLGKITNTQTQPIAHVRLRVRLLDAASGVVGETAASIEQAVIPAGQSAPYSALFAPGGRPYAQATAELMSASSATYENLIPLSLLNENASVDGSRYRVTATLFNDTSAAVGPVRIVLMLLDAEGHVSGFRVMTIATDLEANARQPITIEAVAQADAANLTYQLYAEARLTAD